MLREAESTAVPGLLKFSSVPSFRVYLKNLMEYYERQCDIYGEKVGSLMRLLEERTGGKKLMRLSEVEWKKVGMLMVHDEDPSRGTLELAIEAMEDYKAKATRTREVLTKIEELENLGVPSGASILVYLRHGVPLRAVIDNEKNPRIDSLISVEA